MATANPNQVIAQNTDAEFRAWATAHRDLLLTGSALSQTSDTNQFDFGGATRPAANTDGLPLLLQMTDSLQAVAPYVLAVYYGSGAAQNVPRIRIAIGTGTSGSGTLTGVVYGPVIVSNAAVPVSTTIAYECAACGIPGSVWVAFGFGNNLGVWSQPVVRSFFGLHRIRDHAGAQTADGLVVYSITPSSSDLQCVSIRRVSPTTFGPHNLGCLIVGGTTSSVISGGERQCYAHAAALPEARPVPEYITVAAPEWSLGNVFAARPPGAAADRTYRCLGTRVATVGAGASTSTHALCAIWE